MFGIALRHPPLIEKNQMTKSFLVLIKTGIAEDLEKPLIKLKLPSLDALSEIKIRLCDIV